MHMCVYLYIYIYIIYIYIYTYTSLSLYIYIYIYIHSSALLEPARQAGPPEGGGAAVGLFIITHV